MVNKLKCWNKIGINRHRKENVVIDVSQNMASKKWETTVASPMSGHYFLDKKFKTKNQASKFAKKYMKKHDVCSI